MSGYLQRLASRALNPRASIHPVIDSIFSPASSSNAPESPLADEEQVAANWPQSVPAPQSRMSDVREEPGSPASQPLPAREIGPRNNPRAAVESQTFFKPLVTYPQPPAAHAVLPGERTAVPDTAEIADTERDHASPRSAPAQTSRRPVSAATFPPRVKREQSHPAGRTSATPHQPDEIRIHIGRIEVTAVPPAPAAAPSKPARPSPNLGEYLKRGDRRAL